MGNDKRKKKKMQSSPSHREATPENRRGSSSKGIGCMSGILRLLSRHHSRRRIPSAPIKERIEAPSTAPALAPPKPGFDEMTAICMPKSGDANFSSGGGGLANRSPTLPSEIRRSGGCFELVESPQRPPALVARLMGLEGPTPMHPPAAAVSFSVDSAEEKRRRLLGALERCDEDLRALKRIIDAVRTAEMQRLKAGRGPPASPEVQCLDGNGDQPSPVSVLDAPPSPKSGSSGNALLDAARSVPASRSLVPVFSDGLQVPRKDCGSVSRTLNSRMMPDRFSGSMVERNGIRNPAAIAISAGAEVKVPVSSLRQWRWRESTSIGAAFEEEKEVAGVSAETADGMAGDLVDDLVMELVECWSMHSVQRGRCKRKLYL